MTEFVKPSNTELAALCRAPAKPSRATDGIIFRVLKEVEGDVWSDLFGDEDDIWHRRDPEDRAAWDAPPLYTESFDVALATKIDAVRIIGLEEPVSEDGCWTVIINVKMLGAFTGKGTSPALAFFDAYFQAMAYLHDENGVRTKVES